MLTISNVTLARGAKVLIKDVNLSIFNKQVVGLVGANGCGKSTLFAAILGQLEPSAGEVGCGKHTRVVALAQELPGSEMSALTFTLSGDERLHKVLTRLQQAEDVNDYAVVLECHNDLAQLDGYSAEARAAKILIGLGFNQQQLQQPVKSFSGGWRMRLNLAKCLFTPSDLLLLDEPTNHLDMEAIMWLEAFIKHYQGAVLLVSHDQAFLDNTVSHIAHVEHQRLKVYTGSFSSFEQQHAEYIAQHNAQYQKQQHHISHMMSYVERFRYKASKAKQAQSRLKAIEKMQLLAPIFETSPFHFEFSKPDKMPNPMLSLKKVSLGYEQQAVINNMSFNIMAGDRIGLLGINGAGKSTLIKGISGALKPLQGSIEKPGNLKIGYFAQHQVDYLPLDECARTLLRDVYPNKSEKELLTYLGGFGFDRDMALAPLKQFSGGEKARVALALIVCQRPNLLLLDEPTNHLDLEMRQALTLALQGYEGAMILVSHDRHLLTTLVDELYLIKDHRLTKFDGSVADYHAESVPA